MPLNMRRAAPAGPGYQALGRVAGAGKDGACGRSYSMVPVLDPSGVKRYNKGPLNDADACLTAERVFMDRVQRCGGFKELCCPRKNWYKSPPWITMPPGGRRFKPVGVLPVSGNFTGQDIAVLSMAVDTGYDGVLTDVVCEVAANGATGFIEGSGDVTWRLQDNLHWMRDFGNIEVTLGSLINPGLVPRGGLRIYSRDVLTFFVNLLPAASGRINPSANIICSFTGWMYPR